MSWMAWGAPRGVKGKAEEKRVMSGGRGGDLELDWDWDLDLDLEPVALSGKLGEL